jgi:hypothetical protein
MTAITMAASTGKLDHALDELEGEKGRDQADNDQNDEAIHASPMNR